MKNCSHRTKITGTNSCTAGSEEDNKMKLLEDKILAEGIAVNENILKADGFINHQVDPALMKAVGEDFAAHFQDMGITKVVTIESSGIAPAVMTAAAMNVPLLILKKSPSKVLNEDMYQTVVTSYTKGTSYELTLSARLLSETDHVLIIDDFLANGEAATGAVRLIRKAHATVAGIGILIEKSFQPGRAKLEEQGFHIRRRGTRYSKKQRQIACDADTAKKQRRIACDAGRRLVREMNNYEIKKEALIQQMKSYASEDLIVAFSGGVDSSLLLKLACEAVKETGKKIYGIFLQTMLHPVREAEEACRVAGEMGAVFCVLKIDELEGAGIADNPLDRCYRCKYHLFREIQKEYRSFSNYLWHWSDGKVICETGLASSPLSDAISGDLKRRGMKFVGTTIIYAYLQAVGVIDSHEKDCFLYQRKNEPESNG